MIKIRLFKKLFDRLISGFGLLVLSPIIFLAWIIASIETRTNGIFIQERIGINATSFNTYKIRSMRNIEGYTSMVTVDKDPRITKSGRLFRKTKIDELPQLFNVLKGNMSFVGPRPDVSGFADKLKGDDRIVLSVLPGITGPAQIYFRSEEELLARQDDPEKYNQEIVWPKKIEINKAYVRNWSFEKDLHYIFKTIFPY